MEYGELQGNIPPLTYINDLHPEITSEIRLVADDRVIHRQVPPINGPIILQEDLNKNAKPS